MRHQKPVWKTHQCLRQLALAELVGKECVDLPLDHDALLREVRHCRASEKCKCERTGEVEEAAVQRLIQYSRSTERVNANARFLDLKESYRDESGKDKAKKVETDVAAQSALRDMARQLADACGKNSVKITVFKPNHFATLSVYFAKLVTFETQKPMNGLARWCWGLHRYSRRPSAGHLSTGQGALATHYLD